MQHCLYKLNGETMTIIKGVECVAKKLKFKNMVYKVVQLK